MTLQEKISNAIKKLIKTQVKTKDNLNDLVQKFEKENS